MLISSKIWEQSYQSKTALSKQLRADGTPGMPVTFRSRIFSLPVGFQTYVINIESNIIYPVIITIGVKCGLSHCENGIG